LAEESGAIQRGEGPREDLARERRDVRRERAFVLEQVVDDAERVVAEPAVLEDRGNSRFKLSIRSARHRRASRYDCSSGKREGWSHRPRRSNGSQSPAE
jgi:hypothetical protein